MQLAYDLHIHSCLSPCGDPSMTPNNLVNMAYIKGLDVIALSDHNSAKNLKASAAVARERGVLLIPAMELETREEVHLLCYLPTVEDALELDRLVYERLPDNPNMPDFFGEQQIMDEDDEVISTEPRLLVQSTTLSLSEAADLVRSLHGVPVPAHINRTSNSLLSSLGFIPGEPAFTSVELYRRLPAPEGVELTNYHVLHSSDAHYLEDISERENFIRVKDRTVDAVLDYLASKKTEA